MNYSDGKIKMLLIITINNTVYIIIDNWLQPAISPRSDLYDIKPEPCTPPQYNSNEFIQQLMFNDGSTELKTEYDAG